MMRTDQRDRGAVIPFVAILLPVMILMTSFAVDLGRQRASRRDMQANADVIALDLARLADGRTEDLVIAGDVDHLSAAQALAESAARNEIDVAWLTLVFGTFTDASGFVACRSLDANGIPIGPPSTTCIPNAAQVTARETIDYLFRTGTGSTERVGVAAYGDPIAGFRIGSFGARISASNAGLLNSIITPLLGSPLGLDALSYQGLAVASVGVADLGAELGLLTPDAVLNEEVAFSDAILAAADVLERNGDTANANLLRGAITPQIESMDPITLGSLVAATPGAENAAMAADVNLVDLLTAGVLLSHCTDPADVSTCSALAIPNLTLSLPLVSATGNLRLINGQTEGWGPVGTEARTNQTELNLAVVLGSQFVGNCQGGFLNLKCILGGLLGTLGPVDAQVSTNISLKLAEGVGTIDAIRCGDRLGLDVDTRTGLYALSVTVTVAFGKRGLLGGLLGPLLGSLTFTFSTNQPDLSDLAVFDIPPDVFGVTVEETGQGSIGLSTLSLTNVGGTAVLGTLGGIGIVQTVGSVLTSFVNPLLSQLDSALLGPLTDLLGVNVAGADITPLDVDCDGAGLQLVE